MEKAKQYAKTVHESIVSEKDPSIWEKHMDGLKPKINDLLQMYLPGHVTIEQAEVLACVINNIIWHPEDYLPNNITHFTK